MDKEYEFFKTAYPDRYALLKFWARENRNHMTEAERILWFHVRGKQLGYKFIRQQIIADYIVDFACMEKYLVIEVDGGYHSEPVQQEDDQTRTDKLNKLGFRVLRFANDDVMLDIENTLDKKKSLLNE